MDFLELVVGFLEQVMGFLALRGGWLGLHIFLPKISLKMVFATQKAQLLLLETCKEH